MATRDAVFLAAAEAFSAHGFDGVSVDAIAARAHVNKAMIYYHFDDKLALYREVVRDMLRAIGARVQGIAETPEPADRKVSAFVAGLVDLTGERPWFPTIMIREIAEGAPRLDVETLGLIRHVFVTFGGLLAEGQAAGLFRPVNPVLAYMSTLGPLMFNAARERAAAQSGRGHLPMFAEVPRADLVRHMQEATLRMLSKERE
ncbi:MAG: helix-turn-helix domain-containing protein [Vicinamibacterales bacterium]|nr:helix-turn-helix domain-containing protein [Vicinamibacterales bacterium]